MKRWGVFVVYLFTLVFIVSLQGCGGGGSGGGSNEGESVPDEVKLLAASVPPICAKAEMTSFMAALTKVFRLCGDGPCSGGSVTFTYDGSGSSENSDNEIYDGYRSINGRIDSYNVTVTRTSTGENNVTASITNIETQSTLNGYHGVRIYVGDLYADPVYTTTDTYVDINITGTGSVTGTIDNNNGFIPQYASIPTKAATCSSDGIDLEIGDKTGAVSFSSTNLYASLIKDKDFQFTYSGNVEVTLDQYSYTCSLKNVKMLGSELDSNSDSYVTVGSVSCWTKK
jgi:hypothetical protein